MKITAPRPQILRWALGILAIVQVSTLILMAAASPVQAVQAGATTPPVTVVVPTTAPDLSVFSSHFVPNAWPATVRPPARDVQARFDAPIVHSPADLVRYDPAYALIEQLATARWGVAEWQQLDLLIMHESRYDPRAVNASSGACGIFQSLPCGKMVGLDWQSQVAWGLANIANGKYKLPSVAWAHWVSKSHLCPGPDPYHFVYCGGWY